MHNVALKGKAASADVEAAKLFQSTLEESVYNQYSLKQIFNVDETGLCWKQIPDKNENVVFEFLQILKRFTVDQTVHCCCWKTEISTDVDKITTINLALEGILKPLKLL